MTTALEILTDFSNVAPDILERAINFGNAVHGMIEYYELGKLDLTLLDPILEKVLDAWRYCKLKHGIKIKKVEVPVVSELYQYAGRLDLIADVRGINSIIEIKTRPYNQITDPLQTVAYMQAYNESYPKEKTKKRFFCDLNLVGSSAFFEIKKASGQTDHLNIFLSALALYKWKKGGCKL